jgi:hypothetical protein
VALPALLGKPSVPFNIPHSLIPPGYGKRQARVNAAALSYLNLHLAKTSKL